MRRVWSRGAPAAAIGATAWVIVLLHTPVWAAESRQPLEIPAGPAAVRLMQLAREADVSIMFDYEETNEHRANAISGTLDVEAALHAMLDGTGLQFEFTSPTTITVGVVYGTPTRRKSLFGKLRSFFDSRKAHAARSAYPRGPSEVIVPGERPLADVKVPAGT